MSNQRQQLTPAQWRSQFHAQLVTLQNPDNRLAHVANMLARFTPEQRPRLMPHPESESAAHANLVRGFTAQHYTRLGQILSRPAPASPPTPSTVSQISPSSPASPTSPLLPPVPTATRQTQIQLHQQFVAQQHQRQAEEERAQAERERAWQIQRVLDNPDRQLLIDSFIQTDNPEVRLELIRFSLHGRTPFEQRYWLPNPRFEAVHYGQMIASFTHANHVALRLIQPAHQIPRSSPTPPAPSMTSQSTASSLYNPATPHSSQSIRDGAIGGRSSPVLNTEVDAAQEFVLAAERVIEAEGITPQLRRSLLGEAERAANRHWNVLASIVASLSNDHEQREEIGGSMRALQALEHRLRRARR